MEIKIKEEQIRNNRLARPECRVRIYPRFEAADGAWRSLGAGGGGEEPGQRDEGEKVADGRRRDKRASTPSSNEGVIISCRRIGDDVRSGEREREGKRGRSGHGGNTGNWSPSPLAALVRRQLDSLFGQLMPLCRRRWQGGRG